MGRWYYFLHSFFDKNQYVLTVEAVIVLLWLFIWFLFVRKFDAHLVSAIMLPIPFMIIVKDYISFVPLLSMGLKFIGKYSAYIFMIHTLVYSVYPFTKDFVFSFKFAVITYLLVIGISLFAGITIDKIEQITGYKKLIDRLKGKQYVKVL